MDLLEHILRLLQPTGKLVVTTPNVYHPVRYRLDASHVAGYSYEELGARALIKGFENLRFCRIRPAQSLSRRLFRLVVGAALHRYLGIDDCHTVLLACQRPASDN